MSAIRPSRHAAPIYAFAALAMTCMIMAAYRRGPWIDEFWTLWLTRPDLPLADAFERRWLLDVHPPLFTFLIRLLDPLVGDDMVRRRLLNLIPFVFAAAFSVHMSIRAPHTRRFFLVFSILIASSPWFATYFAEHRSYFSQLCSSYVLLGCLFVIHVSDRDLRWPHDAGLALYLLAAILLSFNLHYVMAMTSGLTLGVFCFALARERRFRWAGVIAASAAAASMPLAFFFIAQSAFLTKTSESFWITTSTLIGLGTLVVVAFKATGTSLVATTLALAGAIRLQSTPIEERAGQASRRFALLLAVAFVLCSAVLLVANLKSPIIMPRYLIFMSVAVACAVAALVADAIVERRGVFLLFLLNAVAAAAYFAYATAEEGRWNETASIIAKQVRACPTSTVYAGEMPRGVRVPNENQVVKNGYSYLARQFGFDFTFIDPGVSAVPEPSGVCPALLWVEHVGPAPSRGFTPAILAERLGLQFSPARMANAELLQGDTGLVLILRKSD